MPLQSVPAADNRRIFPRNAVIWRGRFATEAATHECVVLNVSVGGACVRTTFPPEVGDHGRLTIDRVGEFDAEIVWVSNHTKGLGIRFRDTPGDVRRTFLLH
ncbi:MAG: PilZ domain-containing protein [Rhodospirillaceae bacterium]|nr:PilZ domain-containing protein [Rhodospirillaceae bacterium]